MQHPLHIVAESLKKADLLGTPFIPSTFKPSVFLQVEFPSGASVQLGNEVTPARGVEAPSISFVPENPEGGDTFALLAFDPDAPSREDQKFGPWRHWIIGGLKPSTLDEISALAESGTKGTSLVKSTEEALTPWVGPSPGAGTGLHRYLFLLYRQTQPLLPLEEQSVVKSNERVDRRNFDVAAYVKENQLELVGANFFLCANP